MGLNAGIIAKSVEPIDVWLATKPCHLPFDVIAMDLLRGLDGLFPGYVLAKELNSLFVYKRCEWAQFRLVAVDQPLGFLQQTALEHSARALVDTLVELCSVRVKA